MLVLTRQDGLITFSVLPTRCFHIAGPLMKIWNAHLSYLIFGFLSFPLEKLTGYESEGCSKFSRNFDGAVVFFILCKKTEVLSKFSVYTMSTLQVSKSFLEW